MSKESRLLYLAGLTLSLYAGFNYFANGGLIFPFPLNSFIFLIVTTQFTIWHYKKGFPIYLFFLTAVFGVLANPVFWEVIISVEKLEEFGKYPWMHWFFFLNGLGVLISALYLINKQKRHFTSLITTLGIILYCAGFYTGVGHYEFAGLGLITVSVLVRPTYQPIHFLWILLFVLQFTEWLTFALAA